MASVPAFPVLTEPGEWDELTLLAATAFLEAEGEPPEGQCGVLWTALNRLDRRWASTFHQVILGKDGRAYGDGKPFEVYSCWNDDYRERARARLAAATPERAASAWRAAAGVLWRLIADPTDGAVFYLNVEATRKSRTKHDLPAWAADPADPTKVNAAKVLAVLGRHTFMRG